jgi:hypothetical protein
MSLSAGLIKNAEDLVRIDQNIDHGDVLVGYSRQETVNHPVDFSRGAYGRSVSGTAVSERPKEGARRDEHHRRIRRGLLLQPMCLVVRIIQSILLQSVWLRARAASQGYTSSSS